MAKFSLLLAILFPSNGVAVDEVIEKTLEIAQTTIEKLERNLHATGWSNQNRVALSRVAISSLSKQRGTSYTEEPVSSGENSESGAS